MRRFLGFLLLFGIIALVVGLTTDDAIGWLAIGGGMTFTGVVGLIVSIITKQK